jgi:hypothetical protein
MIEINPLFQEVYHIKVFYKFNNDLFAKAIQCFNKPIEVN